ncbi:MAG: adenosylmethionine--8-amino-7-oxononanoate transaminase [Candidatus Microthrix subdominans]
MTIDHAVGADDGPDEGMTPLGPVEALAFDQAHLWHPYTSIPASPQPLLATSASGCRLNVRTPDGEERSLVDGMSSWWAAVHGYSHPVLVDAARNQLGTMSHVMFGGLTHHPAVELGRRLVELTPPGLERVFFSDSGSVAVEVAVKMALQHWASLGQPDKNRLLTWRSGYHGDTFMAMSACDPEGGMHSMWSGVVPAQHFVSEPPAGIDAPIDQAFVAEIDRALETQRNELAAVIVEPVVQGAGGMRFHNPGYLRVLRERCDHHGVLLIFDEIATGFGRTGPMFAAEWAGVTPDIMCVGKALTGGMMTLAATLCTDRVATAISAGDVPVLAHGPTFMANPLACATAVASLDLLGSSHYRTSVERIEGALSSGLAEARDLPQVSDVRVLGAIGVIEMDHPVDMERATAAAIDAGVWLRPFRNLIYAMPPYICTDEEVGAICTAMLAVAEAHPPA